MSGIIYYRLLQLITKNTKIKKKELKIELGTSIKSKTAGDTSISPDHFKKLFSCQLTIVLLLITHIIDPLNVTWLLNSGIFRRVSLNYKRHRLDNLSMDMGW